jgi:spore germination cell wall hydrolase CwlJ-like protein
MRTLYTAAAVIANLVTLISIVIFGALHYTQAQAEQRVILQGQDQILCLQKNIYFEARNQSTLGKAAVAWVTLNRTVDDRYPSSICAVVQQGKRNEDGSPVLNACQFSWFCDGKPDTPASGELEQAQWNLSGEVAETVLREWHLQRRDPTEGSDHYHADYVTPGWAAHGEHTVRIDDHIFYRVSW